MKRKDVTPQQLEEIRQKLALTLQKAAEVIQRQAEEAGIEYQKAADFFRKLDSPIPQPNFLDWFFFEKHGDKTPAELFQAGIEVRLEDIEEAGAWYITQYRERAEKEKAWELLQGIAERWKGTRPFADRKSFERVHWLNLARKLKAWKVKRESAPSEERFREELKAEFEKLEGQISAKFNKWKPQDSQPRFDVIGLPRGWGLDGSEEAQTYFYTLLTHTLERELLTALFLQDEAEAPRKAPAQQEPSTKVLALHLYFLHRAGYLPELDEGKKKVTLEAWAKREGVSFQNLYQTFNAVKRPHEKNPLKLPILEQVLPTLTDFPEALKLAEEELEQLERKK